MRTSTTQTSMCKYTIIRAFAARTHLGPIVLSERAQRKAVDGSPDKIDLAPPDKHAHCCMHANRYTCEHAASTTVTDPGFLGRGFICIKVRVGVLILSLFFLNIPWK